jgi:hypothetical protein
VGTLVVVMIELAYTTATTSLLGMSDWREDIPGQLLTPQQSPDVVAWLGTQPFTPQPRPFQERTSYA